MNSALSIKNLKLISQKVYTNIVFYYKCIKPIYLYFKCTHIINSIYYL